MAVIGIIAQGMMGAGVGRRLHESGAAVRTLLTGRSAKSAERARTAGMEPAADEHALLAGADFFLSILPPGEAEGLAEQLAPALQALDRKPVYVDCNAVSPQTAIRIGEIITPTGADFVDGGIIGGPPRDNGYTPVLYVSGPEAERLAPLREHGLDVRVTPGPVGAASALKMSYAGITKGLVALSSAMMLAATRAGAAEGLRAELERSQPHLLAWFHRMVPPMYDKAYRWVGEMEEIADFTGPEAAAIYQAIARFYEGMAADHAGPREKTAALTRFLTPPA